MSITITETTTETIFLQEINEFIRQLSFYTSLTVVLVFIIGNILNVIICLRKRIRKEIIGFYNIVISSWNIVVLFNGLLLYFPASINAQDLLLFSDLTCILINYLTRTNVQMSAWLHVFLTIDRYLCVAYNNKLKYIFNNRKRLSLIFVGIFFILGAINVPNLFFRISLDEKSNVKCDSTPLINQIRNMIISLFRIILPIIFQIVFSVLLIYKLFKVRSNVNRNQSMEKEYKFARTILWLNLMFIITEIPFLFITLYFSLLGMIPKFPLDANASHSLAIATLVYYVATLFSLYLFGSIFFVNLFTNTLFKREIKTIFRFRKPSSINL